MCLNIKPKLYSITPPSMGKPTSEYWSHIPHHPDFFNDENAIIFLFSLKASQAKRLLEQGKN